MTKYLCRAFYACAAAAALVPLSICGQDIQAPPNSQPHIAHTNSQPHMPHDNSQPHMPHDNSQPHMPHDNSQPHMPHDNSQPHMPHDAHWQAGAGAAHYGHPHAASDPNGAVPPAPMHASHGYVAHDPHLPPHNPKGAPHGEPPKQFPLWEQSSGSIEVTSHSWQPPLAQENLSNWDVAMSTLPSEGHVVLMPGEANRTGQFWHRQAIPAEQFEVQFAFGVFGKDHNSQEAAQGVANGAGVPEGFAFWYVYEPYANVYPRSAEEQASWNLIGYKRNPKGFGVVFKAVDRDGHINPSISCIHNTEDGRALTDEIPTSSALFYQYRNQPAPVLFRVIVGHQGVVAQIRESVTSAWVTACTLDQVILRPHGFIGFTGYNRPAAGQGQQLSGQDYQQQPPAQRHGGDQILLHFVKLWSLDSPPSSQPNVPSPHHAAPPPNGHHLPVDPHVQQSHAGNYGRFSGVSEAPPYIDPNYTHAEQTILRMLTSFGNQISMLSLEISDMRHDLRKVWGDDGSVHSIKSELTGFKDLFKRHSQQHTSALQTIHKHVENKSGAVKDGHSPILSRLTDLSSQLEQGIAVKHTHSFLLSVVALVLVVLFAFWSFKKLRDIEKKHML